MQDVKVNVDHMWTALQRMEDALEHETGRFNGHSFFNAYWAYEQIGRVNRLRKALYDSAPMAQRMVATTLSGINIATIWHILISACQDIALYYGGSVLAGGAIGGVGGAFFGGIGAAPGVALGATVGGYAGGWVMSLLGLKCLVEGLSKAVPDALDCYQKGFLEAWGQSQQDRRHDFATTSTGNTSSAAVYLANGHVIMISAILAAMLAYVTKAKGDQTVLLNEIRQSPRLGVKVAAWIEANEPKLSKLPALQANGRHGVQGKPEPLKVHTDKPMPEKPHTADVAGALETKPTTIIGRDPVDLGEFRRLNVTDSDVGRMRPGEAGAAAELQNYLKGNLERAAPGTPGDFLFTSGANAGKTVDFMLTPDSVAQAGKINNFFGKNTSGFSDQLALHLKKADFVPMDMRFLTTPNQKLLMDIISEQPADLRSKIILFR